MRKSKRSKTSKREDCVDRISNLPDPILHSILSRIPATEEVIRTSILSTRWRYLWTLVPSVDLDFFRGLKPSKELRRNKFKEFVRFVLAKKSLDLDSFRLCCSDYYDMFTVGGWIQAAVTRNVKLLDLMFCPIEESEDIELPHCLVTCGSLEILRLSLFGRRLSFPNFTGFPSLRVLELNNVELFDDYSVEDFLESCPLLEDLSLKDCLLDKLDTLCISCPKLMNLYIDNINGIRGVDYNEQDPDDDDYVYDNSPDGPRSLQISCPKLVFLELTGHIAYGNFIFESPDSLKKVAIHRELVHDEYMANSICELFVGISHVESLSLGLHFFITCSNTALLYRQHFPESLPNLKTLELTIGIDAFTSDALTNILLWSPNLESLHLIVQKKESWCIELSYSGENWKLDLDEAEKRRILTRHLKRVEFLEFNGGNEELVIVRSLLEHGNVLEKMVFGWGNEARYHERSMKTMKKVSNFHKASSTVKLVSLLNK